MPPKKKKTKFQMRWLSEPIDGYPANNTWLSQNPNNPEEAICMVCIPNKDRAQDKVQLESSFDGEESEEENMSIDENEN